MRKVGKAGSGDGELSLPQDVVAGALGEIYIADTGQQRIQKFTPQPDADADGTGLSCDCDDEDPTMGLHVEINDGIDNQCPGVCGFGSIDEVYCDSGFYNVLDRNEYSWTAQHGATLYEVARAEAPQFTTGCTILGTTETVSILDSLLPGRGQALYYLTRPIAPNVGSWGRTSLETERTGPCL